MPRTCRLTAESAVSLVPCSGDTVGSTGGSRALNDCATSAVQQRFRRRSSTRPGILGWVVILTGSVVGFIVNPRRPASTRPSRSLLASRSAFFLGAVRAHRRARSSSGPHAGRRCTRWRSAWFSGPPARQSSMPAAPADRQPPSRLPANGSSSRPTSASPPSSSSTSAAARGRAATAWLDAAIVCGGAGAVAGALLLTPFVQVVPRGWHPAARGHPLSARSTSRSRSWCSGNGRCPRGRGRGRPSSCSSASS